MRNGVQILVVFRICRTPETFPYAPRAHQCQQIHFQHKIKTYKFSTYFSSDLGTDFHRKINAFCCQNLTFLHTLPRKGVFTMKNIKFLMKIDPKIAWKISETNYNFYFMLQMYILMLGSVESGWECFWDPADSKKSSKSHHVSDKSITIGFSIQTHTGWCSSCRLHFEALQSIVRKVTSRQGYLVSEAELRESRRRMQLVHSLCFLNR